MKHPEYEMFPHSFLTIEKECKDRHDKNKTLKQANAKNPHWISKDETINIINRQIKVKKDECIEVFQFMQSLGFIVKYDFRKELNTIQETYNSPEYVFKG